MSNKKYIDAHLHLQDDRFQFVREEVVKRAFACGVAKMVCNAVCEKDWQEVAILAKQYISVVPCYGVHPWYAHQTTEGWLARLESVVSEGGGIGEIGLDGTVEGSARRQEDVFCAQLDLAARTGKPVTIHCIKRWGRLLEIMNTFDLAASGILLHSFGGSLETLSRLLDLGAYASFSSCLADPSREKMRQAFLQVPIDRLLLETDAPDQYSPYLIHEDPLPMDGEKRKISEPLHVVELYDFAAGLRKIDADLFRQRLWDNGQIFTN
jgi:TatD DNase family protein